MGQMGFGTALLLILKLTFVELFIQPKRNCDFTISVMPRQLYEFNNPNFPGTYSAGSVCRWTFDCPQEYSCRIQCHSVALPETNGCFMDRLLVSTTGNLFFEGAHVFCGKTNINLTSVGPRITLGLKSRISSPGGRFSCTVITNPWAHPWVEFS